MTQVEKDKIIKDLQEKLARAEQIEVDESKRWKPERNEKFWYLNGDVYLDTWTDCGSDNFQYTIGNCFKTEEEAEEYKKQIEYTARYKNYIEEHSEPLDWNDNDQGKYYACFLQNSPYTMGPVNHLEIDCDYWSKCQGTIYASSEQIILDAINEIGEDNFKKYVLG